MMAVFNRFRSNREFDSALNELTQRNLLWFDFENRRYDLHPVVRQHAYDQLIGKHEVHATLRGYFEAVPLPKDDEITKVEDLARVIELYHHTAKENHFDVAYHLFRDRLEKWLVRKFGDYRTSIDLLAALFPDGLHKFPRLQNKRDRSRALQSLAFLYSRTGGAREALPLYKSKIAIDLDTGVFDQVVLGLISKATEHIALGELREAGDDLQAALKTCTSRGFAKHESEIHVHFGRLLKIKGDLKGAHAALDLALNSSGTNSSNSVLIANVYCERASVHLLSENFREGVRAARTAVKAAENAGQEFETTLCGCVLGSALILERTDKQSNKRNLQEAERLLSDALLRCRRSTIVILEPRSLLTLARLSREKGDAVECMKLANEAFDTALRCQYILDIADIHCFIGELLLEKQAFTDAASRLVKAEKAAQCNGGRFMYRPLIDRAQRFLKIARQELGF